MVTRKNRKSKKSKKSNKRFRKTRSKRQRGGDAELDKQLLLAVDEKDAEKVKNALDAGANVNAKNVYGDTALNLASGTGLTEIVIILLNQDRIADVNTPINGYTALMLATVEKHPEIVKLLQEKGAVMSVEDINRLQSRRLTQRELNARRRRNQNRS